MTTIVEVDPRTDERWRGLVTASRGSLFHSPEWSTVLANAYGWSPRAYVVVDGDRGPVAGVPWCPIADATGARVVSLPFSDFAGPVGAHADHALFDALDALDLPVRCRVLTDPDAPTARPIVARCRWHGIPVGPDLADAWTSVSPAARRAIRKAQRERVTVVRRPDGEFLSEFLRLHTGVRKQKYRLLPQPPSFFAAIRSCFEPLGGWQPLAAVRDGVVIAATVYLRFGDTLFYKFNASNPATLGCRPNNLLMWAGIELASELGCRMLDLGASDDDAPGLIRFKRGFGAREREIRTLASGRPLPPEYARVRGLLADLTDRFTEPDIPDALTAAAGSALYRYFA